MGIKGIYGEIGPGQRIALAKVAIDSLRKTGRPLRLAIDISIWQFQIQSGKGGKNPALRTLYYRLLRLLSLGIKPIFVFDGPQKPPFKRYKRTGSLCPSSIDINTKQLLKLFGFPFHVAPGEAEAECALLQLEGIVDAVLSEDVDTLMFGCGRTLRSWSTEQSGGNRCLTHVSVYDAKATKESTSGLDREGMVLVALMSGGDYIPQGIPGCGIKVACEAARAGYGRSLCGIARNDIAGMRKWRDSLRHELQTNENKSFRVKHKTLQIPESFPDREVLGYYTHPVVSSITKLGKLKEDFRWNEEVDVPALRIFAAETFGWTHQSGAKFFIRRLAPALLVSKLQERARTLVSRPEDLMVIRTHESKLVIDISGRRFHSSTDGIPELRLVYSPNDIVGLDLDAEVNADDDYGRDGLATCAENTQDYQSEEDKEISTAIPTKRGTSISDPAKPERVWIAEAIARIGVPIKVEDYEESKRNSRKTFRGKFTPKNFHLRSGMPKGALEQYLKSAKSGMEKQIPPASKKLLSADSRLPNLNVAPYVENLNLPSPATYLETTLITEVQENSPFLNTEKRSESTSHRSRSSAPTSTESNRVTKPDIIFSPPLCTELDTFRSAANISKPWFTYRESLVSGYHMRNVKDAEESSDSAQYPELAPSSPPHLRKHLRSTTPPSTLQDPAKSRGLQLPVTSKRRVLGLGPDSSRLERTSFSSNQLHIPTEDTHIPRDFSTNGKDSRKLVDPLSAGTGSKMKNPSSPPVSFELAKKSPETPPKFHATRCASRCLGTRKEGVRHGIISVPSSPAAMPTIMPWIENDAENIPCDNISEMLQNSVETGNGERKRYAILRESLEGAWKEMIEEEARPPREGGSNRSWRMSAIEVVDMTGS